MKDEECGEIIMRRKVLWQMERRRDKDDDAVVTDEPDSLSPFSSPASYSSVHLLIFYEEDVVFECEW